MTKRHLNIPSVAYHLTQPAEQLSAESGKNSREQLKTRVSRITGCSYINNKSTDRQRKPFPLMSLVLRPPPIKLLKKWLVPSFDPSAPQSSSHQALHGFNINAIPFFPRNLTPVNSPPFYSTQDTINVAKLNTPSNMALSNTVNSNFHLPRPPLTKLELSTQRTTNPYMSFLIERLPRDQLPRASINGKSL